MTISLKSLRACAETAIALNGLSCRLRLFFHGAVLKDTKERLFLCVKCDIIGEQSMFHYEMGVVMRLIYFVDGDNNPPAGTEGIEKLTEEDEVVVFYAKNNTYYGKSEKRDGLTAAAKCRLRFAEVMPGKDAVDFAIAIEAAKLCACEDAADAVYLFVSKDKHFDIVQRQLYEQFGKERILKRVDSIADGVSRYFLFKISEQNDLQLLLKRQYGKAQGEWLYHRIRECEKPRRRGVGKAAGVRRWLAAALKKAA